jgi:osmotically-inducible protein OsmY
MRTSSEHGAQGARRPPADDRLVRLARLTIDASPLRGWSGRLQINSQAGVVTLSGRLPSYYLKQVLQTIVGQVPGVREIDNHVAVEPIAPIREDAS